jgi:hypothetical protein
MQASTQITFQKNSWWIFATCDEKKKKKKSSSNSYKGFLWKKCMKVTNFWVFSSEIAQYSNDRFQQVAKNIAGLLISFWLFSPSYSQIG